MSGPPPFTPLRDGWYIRADGRLIHSSSPDFMPELTAASIQMRRRVDQRPGSLSAAEIAALKRIAETLKPFVDLIARFRPDPESRQAP